jgi:hypothetical protein
MSYSLSKSTLLAGAFSLAFVGAALAHNPNWTPGGGGSCINTCKRANMEAVKSGQYKNLPSEDQSFTVCRANAAMKASEWALILFRARVRLGAA